MAVAAVLKGRPVEPDVVAPELRDLIYLVNPERTPLSAMVRDQILYGRSVMMVGRKHGKSLAYRVPPQEWMRNEI